MQLAMPATPGKHSGARAAAPVAGPPSSPATNAALIIHLIHLIGIHLLYLFQYTLPILFAVKNRTAPRCATPPSLGGKLVSPYPRREGGRGVRLFALVWPPDSCYTHCRTRRVRGASPLRGPKGRGAVWG